MALQFRQGRLTVARPIDAPSKQPLVAASQPDDPFLWSEGGERVSPQDIAVQRRAALAQAQPDFSPVASPWQGLARTASQIAGALELRDLDKQAAAQRGERNKVLEALLGAGNADLVPALTSDDPVAAALAKGMFEARMPKPTTPYRTKDNAGNVWEQDPQTGEFARIFTDIAPKQMVANGQVITSTNPFAAGPPLQITDIPQPGAVVDDPRLANKGGAGSSTPQTFRP